MEKLIAWVEIPSEDFDRCVDFYRNILKIDLNPKDYGTEKMACLPGDEGAIIYAPGFKPSEDGVIVSLHVGNKMDDTLKRIESSGGRILKGKSKIEAEGRDYFALFRDSEGNKLGLYGT